MSTEQQFKKQFDFQLKQLQKFCADLKKYQEEIIHTEPNTQARKTAELNLNAAKFSLKKGYDGMKSIIDGCESAWRSREPPERDIEKFWDDFNKQVMSKYVDTALPYSCKVLQSYLDSH